MDVQVYLLVLASFLATGAARNDFFAVVAPNAIRFGHDEKISLNVFGVMQQDVEVWMEHNGKSFSQKTVRVADENHPMETTIKVTGADIFDQELKERAKHVTLKAQCLGVTKTADLLVNYNSGYLLVQTDKPIYKPGTQVNFRVLALDESLKKAKNANVNIDIIDSRNRTVRRMRVDNNATFDTHHYDIPKYADLDLWTIRAFYDGQFSTEARVTFKVEEYTLPTYGVYVTVREKCVSPEAESIHVNVEGRYVYGKAVEGSASLYLNLTSRSGDNQFIMRMKRRQLQNGNYEFKVNVTELLESPAVLDGNFDNDFPPNGYYLTIKADIFESVTGNEEFGHGKVIFADSPYKFKFDRSRGTYRPGQSYTLQAQILHANNEPLKDEMATVTLTNLGTNQVKEEVSQLRNGRLYKSFTTNQLANSPQLKFQVEVEGVQSDAFTVSPFQGVNQVQIEMIYTDEGTPQIRIAGNIQDDQSHTGIMMLIIARGEIIFHQNYGISRDIPIDLDDHLLKRMSPSARAIAYYFDKKGEEVVTDSVYFEIDPPKCRGEGLKIRAERDEYRPGGRGKLELEGVPFMDVGLNAMDRALLLLNSDNILKTNSMFRLLEQHDLGCGIGGGISSSDVFKSSGLVMLTNAGMANIRRESLSCDGNSRRKREIDEECQANAMCCEMGADYASKLIRERRILEELDLPGAKDDLESKCYSNSLALLRKGTLPLVCINQYLRMCLHLVQKDEVIRVQGKSFEDEGDYMMDLKNWGIEEDGQPRMNFQESWLFEKVKLDNDGQAETAILLPDSITTWMIQAIGFSDKEGVCIAEPIDVKGYKDFFIQLDMPYSAVRLENVAIKATIFNYYAGDLIVHAYIDGVDGVCTNAALGKKSPRQRAVIPGNSATTFTFLVLPLTIGYHDITVTALAKAEMVNQQDAIMKKLLVVGEGKEFSKTKHACLDPKNQLKACENDAVGIQENRVKGEQTLTITLDRDADAVPGTGYAVGYIKSSILSDVVEKVISGTESLLKLPTGCGEQTMLKLAPTVYAMNYIKQTKQVNPAIEKSGYDFIQKGVDHEMQYRKPHNGFAVWRDGQHGGGTIYVASTWLSAFVMKVFCQAKHIRDDFINTGRDITPTLQWLLTRQKSNGAFEDLRPVYHREMIGQMNEKDPSLTAFVVISFMECEGRTGLMNASVSKAVKYLEDLDPNAYAQSDYLLAISTYALAMADSPKKYDMMKMLQNKVKKDGQKMYWGNPGGPPANAQSVETTAYALLAYLNFHYDTDGANIVRWLIQQRQASGAFRTTMDTVAGLQALAEYSIRSKMQDVNLQVNVLSNNGDSYDFDITNENNQVVKVVNGIYNPNGPTVLTVRTKGNGGAFFDIDYGYNKIVPKEKCPFTVTDIMPQDISDRPEIDHQIAIEGGCDVCGNCANDVDPNDVDYEDEEVFELVRLDPKAAGKALDRRRRAGRKIRATVTKKYCINFDISSDVETDMAIVSFGLQTGINVIKKDLDRLLMEQPVIARYEMPEDGKSYIIFYLDHIGPVPVNIKFRLSDGGDGDPNTRQPAKVTIYDYYTPEKECTHFYDVGAQKGQDPLPYRCNAEKNRNCVCLQNICADDFEAKVTMSLRKGGRPAFYLKDRICSLLKANYAVLVKMEKPVFDPFKQYITAVGIVQELIHPGQEDLRPGSEMTFRFKAFCKYPNIIAGQNYYVIARDMQMPNNEYSYELMEDAVVIRKPHNGRIKSVMGAFEKLMKRGCQN